jgi:hypothetical protein
MTETPRSAKGIRESYREPVGRRTCEVDVQEEGTLVM